MLVWQLVKHANEITTLSAITKPAHLERSSSSRTMNPTQPGLLTKEKRKSILQSMSKCDTILAALIQVQLNIQQSEQVMEKHILSKLSIF